MATDKVRLDQLLVERGLASTRNKAQALIMTGQVLVDDTPVDKAGAKVASAAAIRLRGTGSVFVGRGGDKLLGAVKQFQIPITDRICIDVGASTGGFTDCLLQHGAAKVYAVDVGYNQLDHKLRVDQRVVVLEKTHAHDLPALTFSPRPSLGTVDVSFISVRKILPAIAAVLDHPADLLVLVKPQFELGPDAVSKGGVVKDERLQLQAVEFVSASARELGFEVRGAAPSVLKGEKKGNQEYFLHLQLSAAPIARSAEC